MADVPEHFSYETEDKIAIITIDRPDAMNAFLPEMFENMEDLFRRFDRDDDLRVAILTGAGDKAFSAGADLKETIPRLTGDKEAENQDEDDTWIPEDWDSRFLSGVSKPIVAAVNGFCLAGGMEILQGTDIRVASKKATFGLTEPAVGIVPAGGSHIRLPRQVPYCRAMEFLLTADQFTAEEALEMGLINEVVPHEDIMDEAREYAETIASNAPLAVQTAKTIAQEAYDMSREEAFRFENLMAERLLQTEDAKEGPRAFAEKREPNFKGE